MIPVTVYMWNTILELKSSRNKISNRVLSLLHPGEDTPISSRSFCCKFGKAFLSGVLCCGRDLSWLGTMNHIEGVDTLKNPPLEVFIILNRKDSECLSP